MIRRKSFLETKTAELDHDDFHVLVNEGLTRQVNWIADNIDEDVVGVDSVTMEAPPDEAVAYSVRYWVERLPPRPQ